MGNKKGASHKVPYIQHTCNFRMTFFLVSLLESAVEWILIGWFNGCAFRQTVNVTIVMVHGPCTIL